MSHDQQKIKLALVDDHNLFRKGLTTLINMNNGDDRYEIIFEADSGKELQGKLNEKNLPDIVLMDIDMPDMNGFETAAWLRQQYPKIDILVISMIDTEEAVVKMVKMGVKGYLSKDIEVQDMHAALHEIYTKGHYYTDFITGKLVHALNKDGNFVADIPAPTPQNPLLKDISVNEMEFLKLAATEMTYQQVADTMNLSPKTIDGYRDNLFKKFNVTSRVGLVLFAIRNGVVKV